MSAAGLLPKGVAGGRFDFDDGGTYCGGWEDGKAQGHGVCTGPKGEGEFSGSWHCGFEVSGVYTWPSGSTYEGQWQNGKRHGLGVETRGRWIYRGEWTAGLKGRYGVRQSITSGAKYDGTWANGLQDGYGSEIYADGGTFQGQWMKGMRHGYGVRTSAPFGLAAPTKPRERRSSLTSLNGEVPGQQTAVDQRQRDVVGMGRGGFVLKAESKTTSPTRPKPQPDRMVTLDGPIARRPRVKRPRGGDTGAWTLHRSTGSNASSESLSSRHTGESARTSGSYVSGGENDGDELIDNNVIETYMGEWKNDKRTGFGIAERSDGVKYEGEWYNNKKYGYGITTFKNGTEECGKYINNVLVTSGDKRHLFFLRSTKFRRKVEAAVNAAVRGSEIALQKADIAISRTATARGKGEQAETAASHAREDSRIARLVAKQLAPEFQQPGIHQKFHKDAKPYDSLQVGGDSLHARSRSLYVTSGGRNSVHSSKDFLDVADPPPFYFPEPTTPAQSAFLNVFGNNPDRRPSAAGFLRRPSAFGTLRRPSTVVEHKLAPQVVEQVSNPYHNPERRYHAVGYSVQDALEEHLSHYKQPLTNPRRRRNPRLTPSVSPIPAPGYPDLSIYYGITADDTPDSGISESMENEDQSPLRPTRRSTLPVALDPEAVQLNFNPAESLEDEEDPLAKFDGAPAGVIRTGSLQHVTKRTVIPSAKGGGVSARKKSLPDITQIETTQPRVLSREAIAVLSSQRREAIRREEEEAERLRSNPLLYLCSPSMMEWLSQQQLVILVLFINISLAILFLKLFS